jgi:hypothetical protein
MKNTLGACGAQTRAGHPCRRPPTLGRDRCRLHGGASTGPTTEQGKARAAHPKHGIYSDALTPDEVASVEGADKTLGHELLVARVQLRRALLAWEQWSTANPEALAPVEHIVTVDASGETTAVRRRRPDMWGIVDRCLGRIGRLLEQQARIAGDSDADAEELAREIQSFMRQAEQATGIEPGCGLYRGRMVTDP